MLLPAGLPAQDAWDLNILHGSANYTMQPQDGNPSGQLLQMFLDTWADCVSTFNSCY